MKKEYDLKAIDEYLHGLLGSVGGLLDRLHQRGDLRLLSRQRAMGALLALLKAMEEELLLQWRIHSQEGIDALKERQRNYASAQLRSERGFYSLYADWLKALWLSEAEPKNALDRDPWRSLILKLILDRSLVGLSHLETERDPLKAHLADMESLFLLDPHHLCLSFLNLVELGAGPRAELQDPGVLAAEAFRALPETRMRAFAQELARAASPEEGADEETSADGNADVTDEVSAEEDAEKRVAESPRWPERTEELRAFWRECQGGEVGLHPAFRLERRKGRLRLKGFHPPELPRFADFFGIEEQLHALKENAQTLMNGGPALNVLLWGSRGTGKSSSVRALLSEFPELKLIELDRAGLAFLPGLFQELAGMPERFLLFLDDLSFDAKDEEYHRLKSLLDGSLTEKAENLILIATSNRKDLVFQPHLDERMPENRQLIDEQRALDDRFGLKLYYDHPRFKDLKALLCFLADQEGMGYDAEELYREFLRFAGSNNHDAPAGRSIRQFLAQRR